MVLSSRFDYYVPSVISNTCVADPSTFKCTSIRALIVAADMAVHLGLTWRMSSQDMQVKITSLVDVGSEHVLQVAVFPYSAGVLVLEHADILFCSIEFQVL